MSDNNQSVSSLLATILQDAGKIQGLNVLEDSTQNLVSQTLTSLKQLQRQIVDLALFSPNETIEDIATADLVYLTVPYVWAQVEGRLKVQAAADRLQIVSQSQTHLRQFASMLEAYEIVTEASDEMQLFSKQGATNPAAKREAKIKQYQKEKELRTRIQTIRKRRRQAGDDEDEDEYALMRSLLPTKNPTVSSPTSNTLDDEQDEVIREAALLLLRLLFVQCQTQLESLSQELEILKSMPALPPTHARPLPAEEERRRKEKELDDQMWKLDLNANANDVPLLDSSGKVQRPFTILPAGSSDRARLQKQVFQPDHRLPTMSVDEYLAIEAERGNILDGTGEGPTDSELLAIAAEDDDEKAEEKRLKDEKWAQYADENPKGAGNTMNRG